MSYDSLRERVATTVGQRAVVLDVGIGCSQVSIYQGVIMCQQRCQSRLTIVSNLANEGYTSANSANVLASILPYNYSRGQAPNPAGFILLMIV